MGKGGGVVTPEERTECLNLIKEAVNSGARKVKACEILNLNLRTIERWENNLQMPKRIIQKDNLVKFV